MEAESLGETLAYHDEQGDDKPRVEPRQLEARVPPGNENHAELGAVTR